MWKEGRMRGGGAEGQRGGAAMGGGAKGRRRRRGGGGAVEGRRGGSRMGKGGWRGGGGAEEGGGGGGRGRWAEEGWRRGSSEGRPRGGGAEALLGAGGTAGSSVLLRGRFQRACCSTECYAAVLLRPSGPARDTRSARLLGPAARMKAAADAAALRAPACFVLLRAAWMRTWCSSAVANNCTAF